MYKLRAMSEKTASQRLTDPALVPSCRQQILAQRQFETAVDGPLRVGGQLSDLALAGVAQEELLVGGEHAAEMRRLGAALAARPTPDFEASESLLLQVDLFDAYEHLTALAPLRGCPEAQTLKVGRGWLEAGDIGRLMRRVGQQLTVLAQSKT
jgi:hypothetical protein